MTGDRTPPELTITGAMDGTTAMTGDLDTGFILNTTNVAGIDHLIQFAAGTHASEPLGEYVLVVCYLTGSS